MPPENNDLNISVADGVGLAERIGPAPVVEKTLTFNGVAVVMIDPSGLVVPVAMKFINPDKSSVVLKKGQKHQISMMVEAP